MTDLRLTLETLSYITAAAALVFGAYGFWVANDQRRIDATLDFARILFLEAETADQQSRLTRRWLEHREALAMLQSKDAVLADPDSFTLDVVRGDAGPERSEDLTVEVIGIVRALDQMALCVENGLCKRGLAEDLFCNYAIEVADLYGVVIEEVKSIFGEGDLLQNVSRFAAGCPQPSEMSR